MMKTTFTIAGNLALVSLFGLANAGYAQTGKPDAPVAPAHHGMSIVVKASAAKDGTFDVEITENGKLRKLAGLKPGPKGLIELPSGPDGLATLVLDPAASTHKEVVITADAKPLVLPSGAAVSQTHSSNVSIKAIGNGSGTYDVEITENGKKRKLTGVKAKADGTLDLPELKDIAAVGTTISKQNKVIRVEGKPLVMPSGVAATQAHSNNVSVKAVGNGSGTFDVVIIENGTTRKLTGLKPGPKGKIEVPSGVAGHPPIVIETIEGPHGNVFVKVEKPLVMPSGVAATQAHSSNVSVKAIGNGSGTFDVEITENGTTRKLTGLKPGPKGSIEVPSGIAGHPPIVIETTEGPHGNVSVKVEKPLVMPSGVAAAHAQSSNVSVKAIGNGSGTFDVEITENGKTRKLTGVKAKADGSLDIPELNSDAPKGSKVEKQIKVITVDGSTSGVALPDITDIVEVNSGAVAIDVTALPHVAIAPGTAVTVATDGNAPAIVKTGRIVSRDITSSIGVVKGQDVMLLEAVQNAGKVSKEVVVEAKLVNGKKVVASPKMTVLSGQHAKIQVGDIWLSLHATVSPARTISVKGDAGSSKSPKGPGFSVSGLASGGSFTYSNGNAGIWEIKASLHGPSGKQTTQTFSIPLRKP